MHTRKWLRGLTVATLAAVALTACEDTIVNVPEQQPPPPPPITITVTPAQMSLAPGQTQQAVATVSGGAEGIDRGVTWSSSNASVATVSAQGVVTAQNVSTTSTATIIAQANADASVRAGVGVTVTPAVVPPTDPGTPASVTIESITQMGTTNPVNPANVQGAIDVTLGVDRGAADRLEVRLNGQVVENCVQTFGSAMEASVLTATDMRLGEQRSSIVCTINTHAYDVVAGQGVPDWPNAAYTVNARLLQDGNVLDSATGATLNFRNVDTVVLDVQAQNQAFSTGDLLWHGGNVTVTGIPVSYTGLDIVRVRFAARAGGVEQSARTATSAPFTVTFPATSNPGGTTQGLRTVETPNFSISATTVTAAGQEGPSATSTEINRYDARAPDAGDLVLQEQRLNAYALRLCCSNNWVGADYAFMSGKSGHSDAGVGLQDVRFFVGTPTQSNTAIIAAGNQVTTGADLAETATNNEYKVVAVIRDRLDNTSNVALSGVGVNPGTSFGVDKTPPTIEAVGPANGGVANQAINPGLPFMVSFSDQATGGAAPSGFAPNPVVRHVVRTYPGLSAANRCAVGSFLSSTGACRPIGGPGTDAVPASEGYYEYAAYVVDQAGNRSEATINRVVVGDVTPPTLGTVETPASFTGGATASFFLPAEDNLNLWRSLFRMDFGGGHALIPFGDWVQLNQQFPNLPGGLLLSARAEASVPFIRMLQETDGAGAPAAMHSTSGVQFDVQDAAMNNELRNTGLAGVPGGTNFAARDVQQFTIAAPATICRGSNCAGVPTTRTITIRAIGPTGTFQNPFATMHLFHGPMATPTWLGSQAGATAAVTDDGTIRTWTWTFQVTGAQAHGAPNFHVAGITANGDALRTQEHTFTVSGTL
jgi:hypothetical protein